MGCPELFFSELQQQPIGDFSTIALAIVMESPNLIQPHEFPSHPTYPPPSLPSVPVIQPHLFPPALPFLSEQTQSSVSPWRILPKSAVYQQLCLHCRMAKSGEQFSRGLGCKTHSVQICLTCLQRTSFVTCPVCNRSLSVNEQIELRSQVYGLEPS